MNILIYKTLAPFADFCRTHQKLMLSMRYFYEFKRLPHIDKPMLFHEKLFYLACNTDTSMWSKLADKYLVRDYVESRCGGILNELYGVWDKPEDIDFDKLPDSFVIKTNNGCATVAIVRDKHNYDLSKLQENLKSWLRLRFGDISGQCHYSRIEPKIIVEKLLVQDGNPDKMLIDYKISCFNGEPKFISVFSDRAIGTHKVNEMLYDMDWNPHPEWYDERNPNLSESRLMQRPQCWEEMKDIARKLSSGFKYCRVDLYVINDHPIFGELTFTPGLNTYYSSSFSEELGNLIKL